MNTSVKIEALSRSNLDAFRGLFEEAASPCYCRYWHFGGDKNAWLERCATAPEQNFAETEAALGRRDPSALGLLALGEAPHALGWLKLLPRLALPKLRSLPTYRSLPEDDGQNVYSVGCMLVHPNHRGRGIAEALLAAAEGYGRDLGATSLEAYPRVSTERLDPHSVWTGPNELYRKLGFEAVTEGPYPVLRRSLR